MGRTNLLAIKLCSSLPWYTRWWNTIKGWFGSKPNCIKLAALELGTKFCKDLAWYKRWWNNMKGFFGSKADCMKFSEVNLAMKMCKDLAWYSRWWNTFKGWFGSKSSCVELMNLMTACNKLPWYSRWWNSMKGWFGSKPTNCVKNIAVPVNEKIALRIPESKEDWFRKFSEVFRQKGTAMELYEEPAARDLLEKVPSFADEKAMNEAVKFMDMFERSKSVILAQDKVDKQFLAYVEKMIMTWATSAESDKKEFSELLTKNTEVEGLM